MEWHHYRFISTWHLDAPPVDVYRVLSVRTFHTSFELLATTALALVVRRSA